VIKTPARPWRRTLQLVALGAAVVGLAVALEATELFPALRFAVQRSVSVLPSTRAVDAAQVKRGRPIVSLWVADADLYDPTRGILANVLQKGEAWERPASLTYFDGGRPLVGTAVGVRVHGGGSRQTSVVQSFRVYLRRKYGAPQFPPGILFDAGADPLKQIVLHNDGRVDSNGKTWHFNNPLAYDFVRRIGGITVETRPAQMFLNGQWLGTFVLTEHISRPYFRSHFGHDRFRFEDAGEDLYHWVNANRPITMAKLRGYVDVASLTDWFLGVLFCGTEDQFQGPSQIYDELRRVWSWISWDMDQSFLFVRGRGVERDSFVSTLDLPGGPHHGRRPTEVRGTLLADLLLGDPAYREYFMRRFCDMLNRQLTPAFITERHRYYAALTHKFRVPHRAYLRDLAFFLTERPGILWEHATRLLGTGDSVMLEVVAPNAAALDIEGRPTRVPYSGRYFPGMVVEVSVPPSESTRFRFWRLNGRPVEGKQHRLRLRLTENVRIEAVFGDST
jgi:hypothetical protein